jgi:hypothetical protein
VNDLGELVGYYRDPAGLTHGFLAKDPPGAPAAPEASSWAMMPIGFAALGFAGRRSARARGAPAA